MKRSSTISGPPKGTKKAKTTTKVVKKKKASYQPTKVYVGRQPFPNQLFNTLSYTEQVVVTATSGFATYQFSANSLYDPNSTGTGHQPMYFDQLMALYDHYTVLRSRIRITPAVNSSLATPSFAVVYIDDDTSVASSFSQAAEQQSATKVYTWLPAASNPPPIYLGWDAAKTFGPNPQAQDSLQGTASTSPTEQSYFTFVYQDAGVGNFSFTALVQMEFDVVYDELKTLAQS